MTYVFLLLAWLIFSPLGPGLDSERGELGPDDPYGTESSSESEDGDLGPALDPFG